MDFRATVKRFALATAIAGLSVVASGCLESNEPPVPSAGGPYEIKVNLPLTLNGTATDDGTIALYEWDFNGDGTYDWTSTSTGVATYTYTEAGSYTASFRVTDDGDEVATATASVTITTGALPVASAGGPYTVVARFPVTLYGSATDEDGVIQTYEWDLNNDGEYDSINYTGDLTQTFSASGTYTVRMRATDNDGNQTETNAIVQVLPLYDVTSVSFVRQITDHTGGVYVGTSPEKPLFVVAAGGFDGDNTVRLWDLTDGQQLWSQNGGGNLQVVRDVAISPNGEYVVSASDNVIEVWQRSSGTRVHLITGHVDGVWSVTVTPDNGYIVSGGADHTIRIWKMSDGTHVRTLSNDSAVRSVAVSSDGQYIVSGDENGAVKIWNFSDGTLQGATAGHSAKVLTVAISPGDTYIVSGADDQTAKVWNMNTGALVRTISGHTNGVRSVAIDPEGKYVITGSYDGTVKIWDIETGVLATTLSDHTGFVYSVAVSPDGQYLVSSGVDSNINIYQATSALARLAVRR